MKYSLLFLTYNRIGLTMRCFRSLLPILKRDDTEVLILDNGSTDGTPAWLLKLAQRYPSVKVELSAVNHGVAGGRKRLLQRASGEIIGILDSDVEMTATDWLPKITAALDIPGVGLVGAAGWRIAPNWELLRVNPAFTGQVDVLSGYAHFFHRHLLEKGLAMDVSFNGGGAEDDDLCFQVKALGQQVWQIARLGVRHEFAGTWDASRYQMNRKRFVAKWRDKGLALFQQETQCPTTVH